MIHYQSFRGEYERFWLTPSIERSAEDGSLVSLILVMLAMGTQFVPLASLDGKAQTAELYGRLAFDINRRREENISC